MERFRKDAKSLLRASRSGNPESLARAEVVLGERARRRFVLSDAQHVVAREHGYRSWPELKRAVIQGARDEPGGLGAAIAAARDGWGEVAEAVFETGRRYREGEPVRVRIRKRAHRYVLDDLGGAVRLAGKPPGWLDVAVQAADEVHLNVNRSGTVFVGAVEGGLSDLAWLASGIEEASLGVFAAVLELLD